MKTDMLTVTQAPEIMENVLDKIEYIALYTGMARRDAKSMRLMSEEMLSAVKGILEVYEGCLWMETDEQTFSLHMRFDKPQSKSEKDKLVALSKSGKATLPKGVFSRLGAAISEWLSQDDYGSSPAIFSNYSMYAGDCFNPDAMALYHYLPPVDAPSYKRKEKAKSADELAGIEKSIIDAIVDDLTVTVNSDYLEITALKKL